MVNIQFKLNVKEKQELKSKIENYGFQNYASFFNFLAKNFLDDNLEVHMGRKRTYWETTSENSKRLEEILKHDKVSSGFNTFEEFDKYIDEQD